MQIAQRLQYYILIFSSLASALFVFASPVAAQSCGDFVYESMDFGTGEITEDRYEIDDCNNPFEVQSPPAFDYTFAINGIEVANGGVFQIASTTTVQLSYSVFGGVIDEGENPLNPRVNFQLWRHQGQDYYQAGEKLIQSPLNLSSLPPGTYTGWFLHSFNGGGVQVGMLDTLLRYTFLPQIAYAYEPGTYRNTVTFTIEEPVIEPAGASSVLFLPGIKASRLYTDGIFGTENRLWEPESDADVLRLSMNESGETNNSIYTNDVLESVGLLNFYKDFVSELKKLKDNEKAIKDYLPFAYDWRYDVFDVATMGIPYPNGEFKNLKDEVLRLAAESYTGKVTLIGHSNGGLVAKALLNEYGGTELAGKVDKIIMIGTPQLGTPQAIGSLLHGYDEGMVDNLLTTDSATREVIRNMPGAYGLLPTNRYFDVTGNEAVITSDDTALTAPIRSYGDIISSLGLAGFLTDSLNTFPAVERTSDPQAVNEFVLSSTLENQQILDDWEPPEGVDVYEVVGSGLATIKRFEYRSHSCGFASCPGGRYVALHPITTNYGDGVVVGNSAEGFDGDKEMLTIDLKKISAGFAENIKHENLTETEEVQEFVISAIKYPYLTDTLVSSESSQILSRYTIVGTHSPVTVRATTNKGRVGIFNNQIIEEVPGSQYFTLGESTYLVLPSEEEYEMEILGTGDGAFSLTIEQLLENDSTEQISYLSAATTTATMRSTFSLNNREISNLSMDYQNDGVIDLEQTPNGEIVHEEPPEPLIYTYSDLAREINNLELKKGLKAALLIQVKLAQKFSNGNNKIFEKLERRTLESLLNTLKAYNNRKLISGVEHNFIKTIISSLN